MSGINQRLFKDKTIPRYKFPPTPARRRQAPQGTTPPDLPSTTTSQTQPEARPDSGRRGSSRGVSWASEAANMQNTSGTSRTPHPERSGTSTEHRVRFSLPRTRLSASSNDVSLAESVIAASSTATSEGDRIIENTIDEKQTDKWWDQLLTAVNVQMKVGQTGDSASWIAGPHMMRSVESLIDFVSFQRSSTSPEDETTEHDMMFRSKSQTLMNNLKALDVCLRAPQRFVKTDRDGVPVMLRLYWDCFLEFQTWKRLTDTAVGGETETTDHYQGELDPEILSALTLEDAEADDSRAEQKTEESTDIATENPETPTVGDSEAQIELHMESTNGG